MACSRSAFGARDLHAAPAAAGRRLHQHRKADVARDLHRLVRVGHAAFGARHAGNAEAARRALGLDLVAHDADVLGLRADEGDVVILEDFREARILRQEAVARMQRVRAGDLAGRQQRGNVEIGIARRRRADADGFVGEPHVHRIGVGGRIDRDRRDPQLLRRAKNAKRDFAAVGDQDLVEHLITR